MKKILLGIAIGIFLTVSTTVYASDSIQALLFPAKIKINGQEKKLDSEYQILNVNGHAYVPIRYVAENIGINIGYDDNSRTIFIAYGNTAIQDKSNNNVYVSDLIATSYDKYLDSTKVTGHLSLNTKEPSYVNAVLEFYDAANTLMGTATIQDDFQSGTNNIDIRSGEKDLTNFSSVMLKVKDVHPAMKSYVTSLFEAAKLQDQPQIQKVIDSIPTTNNEFLLLDFMKWSVPYTNEEREYILPSILKQNVNVNVQDKTNGYTALLYASIFSTNLITPLINAGADVEIKGNDGSTALLMIASKPLPDLVKLLLDKGSDPNVIGFRGYTPLLTALRPMFANYTTNTIITVKYLLDAGANVDVKEINGSTPLQIVDSAPVQIKSQLQSLLLEYGAK